MPKSPEEMMAAMMKNLVEKTGHDMDYWLPIARSFEEDKHMAIIKRLKSEYGLTHGYANLIAFKVREGDQPAKTDDEIFADQYAKKPDLLPIYNHLEKIILGFGDDISKRTCKGYVAFRTGKQFAILKPSTKTRMDVGFMLKGKDTTNRFKTGKAFSGMMSHHAEVFSTDDVDDEMVNWLKEAYDRA